LGVLTVTSFQQKWLPTGVFCCNQWKNSHGSCMLTMYIRCMWLTWTICHWPEHLESFSKDSG
jgi:hypothetical protein